MIDIVVHVTRKSNGHWLARADLERDVVEDWGVSPDAAVGTLVRRNPDVFRTEVRLFEAVKPYLRSKNETIKERPQGGEAVQTQTWNANIRGLHSSHPERYTEEITFHETFEEGNAIFIAYQHTHQSPLCILWCTNGEGADVETAMDYLNEKDDLRAARILFADSNYPSGLHSRFTQLGMEIISEVANE